MKRSVIFPDYGSQYVGMGKELYDTQRVMQEYFEEGADCLSINFVKLCFASSDVELTSLPQGPLALFLVEAASGGLLHEHQTQYDVLVGIDVVSWYAAVHTARAVSFPDGLYMIRKWAELYTTYIAQGTLHSLRITLDKPETIAMVTAWCEQLTERGTGHIAVTRVMPDMLFVVGAEELCTHLQELLAREAVVYHTIEIGEHFDLVMPPEFAQQGQQYLEKVDFAEPVCPVMDPIQGSLLTTAAELRATAALLLERPVRADASIAQLKRYKEHIIAIPSSKARDRLLSVMPNQTFITLESESISWHSQAEQPYHDGDIE